MQCYVCGNFFDDNMPFCPVCGAAVQEPDMPPFYDGMPPLEVEIPAPTPVTPPAPHRKKPHIALRIGMQLLSFVLCLILLISLVGMVIIADVNLLTSSGGIKQLISAVLLPNRAPHVPHPMVGMSGGLQIDPGQIDPDLLDGTLPEGVEDAITSGDTSALVDMLYETMQGMMGEEIPITKDQLQTFVEESTVTDYIAEKAAGYAEDILNGTENTQITAEELVNLVEENKELIEQTFEVEITEEVMTEIETNVTTIVEENDINTTIRTEINNAMDSAMAGSSGLPLEQIMEVVRILSRNEVLYGAIGLCALLILLLCGANFYNVPAGMTWAAMPCILIGGILATPVAILQLMPSVLGDMAVLAPMVNVLAPIHYAVPAAGLVLLIVSIIWRIVRSCVENNRSIPETC